MSRTIGLVLSVVALASVAAGCKSTCVRLDERIVVDVVAGQGVNASNGTPQPVRFRVWGVKDKALFEAVPALKLVEGDAAALERQGVGKAFEDGAGAWIRPGGAIQAVQKVSEDNQFAYVGIAVRYPQPKFELVALDCSSRTGYTLTRPEHRVAFSLDGDSIRVGGAEPAAR